MADWNFGGTYADVVGKLQENEFAALSRGDELAHKQSLTRLNNANASSAEHRVAAENRMSQIMNGMTLTEGETGSSAIMRMAGAAMKAGDSTTARDLILRATQAQQHEAQSSRYAALASQAEFQQQAKKAERYGQLMLGVKQSANPREAFHIANRLFAEEFGEEAPAMEYDPKVVDILYNSSISLRDRAYAEHLSKKRGIEGERLQETRRYHDETLNLRREAEARRARTEAANAKAGGKDVGAPTTSEVKSARAFLEQQGKLKGLDPATQTRAASDLAARARAMRKSNPGLDHSEATQRALVELTAEGYYATERATSGLGKLLKRERKVYGKPGGTPDRPLGVPPDRKFQKGTYYNTPKGSLLYLGDGKWQVPEAPSAGADDDEEE